MLTPDRMTDKHVQKLLDLVEKHARLEVLSRMGEIPSDVRISTVNEAIDAMDDLRMFVFGTNDLVELAHKFGVFKSGTATKTKAKTKKKVKVKVRIDGSSEKTSNKKKVKKKVTKRHLFEDDDILGDILGS